MFFRWFICLPKDLVVGISLFIIKSGLFMTRVRYILTYGFFYRPIAGHANLCPGSISTKRQELDILLSTVKHEMLHALGFSVSLFAFYRDSAGRPLTPRGNFFPKLIFGKRTRSFYPWFGGSWQILKFHMSWYFS